MPSRPSPIYRLLHSDYHEDLSVYSPKMTDFYDSVMSRLPEGWTVNRQSIWFYCRPSGTTLPQQGWKIHISATPADALDILRRVSDIIFKRPETSFKFALDMNILLLLNGKNWSRGGSGKFITIYPPDNHTFLQLIDEIHSATKAMHGPYILSDHRYKESGVVFYRYGGMQLYQKVNVKGERSEEH